MMEMIPKRMKSAAKPTVTVGIIVLIVMTPEVFVPD